MIIDFQFPTVAGGVITFPDIPFPTLPKQPDQILETIQLFGSSTCNFPAITGEVDTQGETPISTC